MSIEKDGTIIINEWNKGIEESAYIGNGDIRFCNTDEFGSLQVGRKFVEDDENTTDEVTGKIIEFEKVANGKTFTLAGLDDNQELYTKIDSTGKWNKVAGYSQNGRGGGLKFWKDYLFIFRDSPVAEDTRIDLYGPVSTGASLTADWQTLSSSKNVKVASEVGNSDILYMGYDNLVASLEEVAGETFDPTDTDTYEFTQERLVLPEDYTVSHLEEMGEFIMVGTNSDSGQSSKVFPWDKLSLESETPIKVTGGKIGQMTVWLNTLFIRTGRYGDIYAFTGSSFNLFKQIPRTLGVVSLLSTIDTKTRNGMTVYEDRLVFTSGIRSNDGNLSVVFSLDTNKSLQIAYKSSNDNVSSASTLPNTELGALFADYSNVVNSARNDLLMGWQLQDSTDDFGIDILEQSSSYYDNYDSNFVSQFYRVGTSLVKKTFHEVDFILSENLATGDNIKLEFRTTINGSWTTGAEMKFADQGAVSEYTSPSSITSDLTNIQFRVSLDGTPKGLEIRIK